MVVGWPERMIRLVVSGIKTTHKILPDDSHPCPVRHASEPLCLVLGYCEPKSVTVYNGKN